MDERNHSTIIDDRVDPDKMTKEQLKDMVKTFLMVTPTTIIDEKVPQKDDLHPTMKPVTMIANQVRNSTRKGEIVLDLFGGSGTTMIACDQLGRRCYMMEYDPKYADVIIDRWERLTGGKAEKI